MPANHNAHDELDAVSRAFYQRVIHLLNDAKVRYLVGGAYALGRYTGIQRDTKDFDIFIRRADYDRVMSLLGGAECTTELTFPHWLGKAMCGDHYIDVIFSSGNGVASVDEEWFDHALEGVVLDLPVLLNPAEEMIWSKAFIQERERFDGADILHLIRARGLALDWPRLLRRFGPHWRVLLIHLVMFGFVYPSDRDQVPAWVMEDLLARLAREMNEPPATERICYGTMISRAQYLIDIERWGYRDARLVPPAVMTDSQVERWTAAIEEEST
jgi:hypothetical protein